MAKISDMIQPKSATIPTSIKVSKDILSPLKVKLKRERTTMKAFFEAAAKTYLNEK